MDIKKVHHFKTESEMVNKSNIDANHWINRDMIRFTKKNVYENTKETIQFLPSFVADITFKCDFCHKSSQPNWLEKRAPLMPYVTTDGLHIIPNRNCYTCPNCNNEIWFDIPNVTHQKIRNFFGDEAYREVGTNVIMTYTFIGEPSKEAEKESLIKDFHAIKKALVPNIEPDDWILHMKDLFGNRKKIPHLSHITLPQIIDMITKIGIMLNTNYGKIHIYNSSGLFKKPNNFKRKNIEQLKSIVYFPIVLYSIHDHTEHGFSPRFILEREQKNGWATSLFDRGKLTLAWPYITHFNPIPQPLFVKPAFSPFLELADVISFVVARFLFKVVEKAKNKGASPPEFDPKILGKIHYSGFNDSMGTIYRVSDRYPLQEFFKGTKWENVKFEDRSLNVSNHI